MKKSRWTLLRNSSNLSDDSTENLQKILRAAASKKQDSKEEASQKMLLDLGIDLQEEQGAGSRVHGQYAGRRPGSR